MKQLRLLLQPLGCVLSHSKRAKSNDCRPKSEMKGFESRLQQSLALQFKVIMNQHMRLSTSSRRCWRNVLRDTFLCPSASAESKSYSPRESTSALWCLKINNYKSKNRAPDAVADSSTDLKVQNASIRRGLACEQAEKVRHAFMAHMTRAPPGGFRAPDNAAVLRADKELWMKAFERCKSSIRMEPSGKLPMDGALLDLYNSPEVVFHLLPTSAAAGTKRPRSPDSPAGARTKADPPQPKGKPAAKPKNKNNKRASDRVKVPDTLKGYSGMSKDNLRICYNYDLPHGCSNGTHEKDGRTRCVKGCHECIKCGGRHSMQSCQKK